MNIFYNALLMLMGFFSNKESELSKPGPCLKSLTIVSLLSVVDDIWTYDRMTPVLLMGVLQE